MAAEPAPGGSAGDIAIRGWTVLLWTFLTLFSLLLLTLALPSVPCPIVALLVILAAFPIWIALRESFLLSRRILLGAAATEGGWLRRWFWSGRVGAGLRVLPALLLSLLLLATLTRLSAWHWLVLFADAAFLAWFYPWLKARTRDELKPEFLGIFTRRWPLWWGNLLFLTALLFALNYFHLGAPDLRQVPLQEVLEQTWSHHSGAMACPHAGAVAGALAALETGSWAVAQQWIPVLPSHDLRLLAWVLFVLQLGIVAALITTLLAGVLAFVEKRRLQARRLTGTSTASLTFVATILLLALASLFAALQLRDLDLQTLAPDTARTLPAADHCSDPLAADLAGARHALDTRLGERMAEIRLAADAEIERELDQLFQSLGTGVDTYLDWYFTVLGEYQRLVALAAGDFADLMVREFERHVFESQGLDERIAEIDLRVLDRTWERIDGLSTELQARIAEQIRDSPCRLDLPDLAAFGNLERDALRAGGAAAGGSAAGIGTVAVAKKVLAKESLQIAAAVATKTAAKKGAGVLAAGLGGAALCAGTGPGAVLCGIGTAVGAWLAIDKAAIEIDSRLSRERMREDILAVLHEERDLLRTALQARHHAMIAGMDREIRQTVDGLFIPARDR